VLILAACCYWPFSAAADRYEGKQISRIAFDPTQQPLTTPQLLGLLPVKAGEPLHQADIRQSIQRLYATGEYEDIAVDATEDGDRVQIRFITTPAVFIGRISAGNVPEPPNQGQLVTASRLQLGAQYTPQDVQQAVESIVSVLKRNGFYNATVVPERNFHPNIQEVDINFAINPGKRAKFGGLDVTGKPDRSIPSILHATGWKPLHGWFWWRPLTENRLQSGIENVRSWYLKNEHLLSKVTLTQLDFQSDENIVIPHLDVDAGPAVKVEVGGAKISKGRLRSLLPIYQERSVDKDLIVEGQRDLTQYFQTQGYFAADVTFDVSNTGSGGQTITYIVDKGARHKLVSIEITGNKYFNRATLRERMYILAASFLRFPRGRYSHEFLERDLDSIRDLYRGNGFRDVEVTSREVDDFNGKTGQIGVVITIKEGPQSFVSGLSFSGVSSDDEKYLKTILLSTEGQPYSDLNLANDRDNILQYYFDNGYAQAKFSFTSTPAAEANHVNLNYIIDSGPREYVRDVVVTGLEKTNHDLVSQRISLKPGAPLSQSQISESQKRLYDLGIFAKVNTAIQNPDGEEPDKYVLYSLEEARRYLFNAGFGAEIGQIGGGTTTLAAPAGTTGFSPRVSLGISRLNVLGLGHTVNLQTVVSTLEQRALLTYVAPQFEGNPNLSLQFSGLFDIEKDIRTFSARREEGSVQLSERLSKANQVQVRYVFRKVNILGKVLVEPELIPLLSQPVRVGLISGTFIQDRRDNALDAHRGIYNTVDIGFAAGPFGSQTGFARILARNATYHRISKNVTLARSTYFGAIQRLSGLPDIPLAERFFSGGSDSQRAFPDNQAGPRDLTTGFPVGGNALLMNTIELRFPLIGDNVGGVLFNDMGNVYSSLGNISMRFHQRDYQDFDYGVQAFGIGIRYRTPIGPVRLDFSLSPNSPRFVGFQGTYDQLIFGTGQTVPQRINVFQFHFSLGQQF